MLLPTGIVISREIGLVQRTLPYVLPHLVYTQIVIIMPIFRAIHLEETQIQNFNPTKNLPRLPNHSKASTKDQIFQNPTS